MSQKSDGKSKEKSKAPSDARMANFFGTSAGMPMIETAFGNAAGSAAMNYASPEFQIFCWPWEIFLQFFMKN